jgi:GWxTD domain-containing protein
MRLDIIGNGLIAALQRTVFAIAVCVGLLFSGCSSSMNAPAECYYTAKAMQHTLPVCESFNLNVKTKDGNRLDIYFQIPYSRIHFEKDYDIFKASYTVSFVLRDGDGAIVRANDVDRTVVAQSYAETVSSLHDAFLKMLFAPPGSYTLDIIVVDNRSRLQSHRRQHVEVEGFSKEDFCASDYLLFEYARPEEHAISLKPIFPSALSSVRDSIGMFQEIYNVRRGDTVRLSLSYSSAAAHDTTDAKFDSFVPPYNLHMPPCMRAADSICYRSDSVFISSVDGVLQVFQYFPKPTAGMTTVSRKIFLYRNGATDSSVSTAKFPVYTTSFPHLNGVDEEIAAVSYIARPQEIDSIRAGSTPGARFGRLLRFWEDHGGTVRRKEFHDRVEEANELFSSCTEGWKTPMGISYIVCGSPDYVECRGLVNEVWYYDLGNSRAFAISFRKTFEFENGRYFEIVPFSVNDFIWGDFVSRWRRQ